MHALGSDRAKDNIRLLKENSLSPGGSKRRAESGKLAITRRAISSSLSFCHVAVRELHDSVAAKV